MSLRSEVLELADAMSDVAAMRKVYADLALRVAEKVLITAASHAKTWGGLPPSPQGRRIQLAKEILELMDEP